MNFNRLEIHAILDTILDEIVRAKPDLVIGGGGQTSKSRNGVGLVLIIGDDFIMPGNMTCDGVAKFAADLSKEFVGNLVKGRAECREGYKWDANNTVQDHIRKAANADKPSPN